MQKCVVVYLYDILIYSSTTEAYRADVVQVLQLLCDNRMFCKLEKCEFHVTFLGYVIISVGLAMDPLKLSGVLEWPRPVGLKAIQMFLGFTNYYRRFIKNFLSVVKPLTDMTNKGADTTYWSPEAIRAFKDLNVTFTKAPILSHPNLNLPFTLEVESGVGALLWLLL
ncbi:uncharacterized protein WCC33_011729 [Rhinophrynus dorsalis]